MSNTELNRQLEEKRQRSTPTRRVSLLSESFALYKANQLRNNGVYVPPEPTTRPSRPGPLPAPKPTSQGRTLPNPDYDGFAYELIPDEEDLKRLRGEQPLSNVTARTEADPSQLYGDEILPPSTTLTPDSLTRTPSPGMSKTQLALTPIRYDSPLSTLRKGGSYNKLQDVNKVGKTSELQKNRSKTRLHRVFSENETNKFDPVNGRRMFHDSKHRPFKMNPYGNNESASSSSSSIAKSYIPYDQMKNVPPRDPAKLDKFGILNGLQDEYFPDLDFQEAVRRWNDVNFFTSTDQTPNSSLPSSSNGTPIGTSHAQVSPVSVPAAKRTAEEEEAFIECQLPPGFGSMKYSERKKVLSKLSLHSDPDILQKVSRHYSLSKSKSSIAYRFNKSAQSEPRSLKLYEEGAVVMDHKLGRILGTGAWGVIRECRSQSAASNGEAKAMKIIRTKNDLMRTYFKKEARVWAKLEHPNILPLISMKETEEAIFCLTTKASGGNLYDLVVKWGLYSDPQPKAPRATRLSVTREYLLQVISALMYMHSRGYVHGDVKLENCLIDVGPPKLKILLCDFGMSTQFKVIEEQEDIVVHHMKMKRRPSIPRSASGDMVRPSSSVQRMLTDKSLIHDDTRLELVMTPTRESDDSGVLSFDARPFEPKSAPVDGPPTTPQIPDAHIGSLPYAAPELLEAIPPPLGPTADIWALGVMMYTMCVGMLPFQHAFEPRLRAMIQKGDYNKEAFHEAVNHNQNFIMALEGCLTKDLTKRMTLEEMYTLVEGAPL